MMKTGFGYLGTEDEIRMLRDRKETRPIDRIEPVMTVEDIREMQAATRQVRAGITILLERQVIEERTPHLTLVSRQPGH